MSILWQDKSVTGRTTYLLSCIYIYIYDDKYDRIGQNWISFLQSTVFDDNCIFWQLSGWHFSLSHYLAHVPTRYQGIQGHLKCQAIDQP